MEVTCPAYHKLDINTYQFAITMPKEKNFNPVQAAKKSEKQKQLKKQKASVQAQRSERLARQNPARIQRDIDALKALSEGGDIRAHERQKLAELERNLAAVNKARSTLGDKAPQFRERRDDGDDREGRGGWRGGRGGVLGKRSRDGGWKGRDGEESSDTDADVADIPMPRDTPPPIPRRRQQGQAAKEEAPPVPEKPTIVYEAAPEHRNLRKEATRFVPAAVAQKLKQAKGEGRLLEEDEFDKLEKEGYIKAKDDGSVDEELEQFLKEEVGTDVPTAAEEKATEAGEQEDKAIPRDPRHVAIEEVEDEDL
jgi:hypothetical protein